jgi:hypothetical protein
LDDLGGGRMLRVRVLIALLFAVPAAACAVMESRFESDAEGIVYYVPRSLVKVTVTPQAGGGDPLFGFTSDNIPDVANRYALTYRNNPFFHDRLCVTIDKTTGYLTSIEYASEDKTPAIAVALAELAGKLSGGPPSRPAGADEPGKERFAAPPPPFEIRFDPLDAERIRQVNNEINRRLGAPPGTYRLEFPDLRSLKPQRQACDGKGVCFRTKIRAAARVTRRERGYEDEVVTQVVDNIYGPIGNLDLSRAFLVEKVVRLTFDDGALEKVIMKKPSEALKAALLPLSVLDVLLAVPTNFVDNVTGTKSARDAYVAELDQRVTAINGINASLNRLEARQNARADSDAGDTTFKISCQGGGSGGH